jgi:hypothetical protein
MAIASFPTILLYHVSEMYVPPLLLPFALICGISTDGWIRAPLPARMAISTAAGVALVFSLLSIHAKVAGLVDVGDRAYRQLQQIVSLLPPDARNLRIGARYLASDRAPGDRYAVFRMPDSILLVHRDVLDFALPFRGLTFDSAEVEDFSKVNPAGYDLIAGWDATSRTFIPLQPAPR